MVQKIILDARMIGPIGHGIARYVDLLARGLQEIHREKPLPYQLEMIVMPGVRVPGFRCIESRVPFLNPREWLELPKILKKEKADLYHSPSFASLLGSPCPWVVTVHDLNHLHYGSWAQKVYYQFVLKRFALRAKKIMSVSQFSADELNTWLGGGVASPSIVWNPIEPPQLMEKNPESEKLLKDLKLTSGKYWLTLAGWKSHKNLETLLSAAQKTRQSGCEIPPLVVAASPPADGTQYPGVIFLGGLSDSQVNVLLSHAAWLWVPSEYEGFGRPPLEALVRGVPVVLSSITPHREGMAIAGVKTEDSFVRWIAAPKDENAWIEAMRRAASEKEAVRVSAEVSERILQKISPRKCAQTLDQIYRDVLGLST